MADLSDDDYEEIASKVVERLDPGRYGSRFVLSRRQLMSLAGVAGGGGVLATLGVDQASAQASDIASADTNDGKVGAAGSPEDVVIDQLRDPGGDEVFNVDDTGAVNAQPREWAFNQVGAQSVNTGDLDIDNFPASGSVKQIISAQDEDTPENEAYLTHQYTQSVSTTATSIYDAQSTFRSLFFMVFGERTDQQSTVFFDLVHGSTFTGGLLSVINSEDLNGPDTRTYSQTGSEVELTMGGNEYDVGVVAIDAGIVRP